MEKKEDILLKRVKEVVTLRWQEVALIVIFQAGLILTMDQIRRTTGVDAIHAGTLPGWTLFVLGFGFMVMSIIWQMLYLGFLRTAAVSGAEPKDPAVLLTIGRPFFWRILGVQILLGLALWVIAGILAGLLGSVMGYQQAERFPPWLAELAMVAAVALLVKPLFLIPSFVLVLDYQAIKAAKLAMQVRLIDLGDMINGYGLGLAAMAAVAIAVSLAPEEGIVHYLAKASGHLVQSLIVFLLMLATVLFVAIETEKK